MSNRQKPTNASEPDESFELSSQDEADLQKLQETGDVPYHSILEVWQHQLTPAEAEGTLPPAPGWCSRITSMYPQIKMQQMVEFRDRYFGKIAELKNILDVEISGDENAFKQLTPEDDRENNRHHYKNLLLQWQFAIITWEHEWDCTDEFSAVELGAISEVHKMFFSEVGVTAFLDNIGFQMEESDQLELAEALQEFKAAL